MMSITLYYIKGLTRTDEPTFDTISNQEKFLKSHIVSLIDGGFYPPHYNNKISLEINSEIDITSQINYLSISFNNKEYYYFIDNITYINEGVISLSVTMDVIQTYMFDIDFITSFINRSSIKRFDNNKINRNYVRENFSNGLFKCIRSKDLAIDSLGALVIKFTKANYFKYTGVAFDSDLHKNVFLNDTVVDNHSMSDMDYFSRCYIHGFTYKENKISDGAYYLVLPFLKKYGYVFFTNNINDSVISYSQEDILRTLRNLASIPGVVDIRYFSNLNNLGITYTYNSSANAYYINLNGISIVKPLFTGTSASDNKYVDSPCLTINLIPYIKKVSNILNVIIPVGTSPYLNVKSDTYLISYFGDTYVKNINKGVPFSAKYIPQLIDENYYHLYFGERSGYTSYPLSLMEDTYLYGHYVPDFCLGVRIYYIQEGGDILFDRYQTLIQDNSEEVIALYNDAWANYLSQNIASYTRGYKLAHQNSVYNVVSSVVGGINDNVMETYRGADRSGITGAIFGAVHGTINSGLKIGNAVFSQKRLEEEHKNTKENLLYTPDTIKQGNSVTSDIIGKSVEPFMSISVVTDLDDCATTYALEGYRVHITTTDNLFNYQNRFYYDVLQCSQMDFTLKIINDERTIDEIKSRFLNGLRLWHTTNGYLNIGDNMGNVLLYDNVEI